MSILIHCGNRKISKNTMILNMGSSFNCPSKKLGLCKVSSLCYAEKAEKLYPEVLPYRTKQENYWLNNSAEKIHSDIKAFIKKKRNKPQFLRFNESGDFHSINCVNKLNYIAKMLKSELGVTSYGYSARIDLFNTVSPDTLNFIVKLSGYELPGYSSTMVVNKKCESVNNYNICSGIDCMNSCKLCAQFGNVAFKKH